NTIAPLEYSTTLVFWVLRWSVVRYLNGDDDNSTCVAPVGVGVPWLRQSASPPMSSGMCSRSRTPVPFHIQWSACSTTSGQSAATIPVYCTPSSPCSACAPRGDISRHCVVGPLASGDGSLVVL